MRLRSKKLTKKYQKGAKITIKTHESIRTASQQGREDCNCRKIQRKIKKTIIGCKNSNQKLQKLIGSVLMKFL